MERLHKSMDILYRGLDILSVAFFGICTITLLVNVFMRNIARVSYPQIFEISVYFMIYSIFLFIGCNLRNDKHTKFELVTGRFSPKVKRISEIFVQLVISVFFGFMTVWGIQWVVGAFELQLAFRTWPSALMGYVYLIGPIGTFFVVVFSMEKILTLVFYKKEKLAAKTVEVVKDVF